MASCVFRKAWGAVMDVTESECCEKSLREAGRNEQMVGSDGRSHHAGRQLHGRRRAAPDVAPRAGVLSGVGDDDDGNDELREPQPPDGP